MRAAALAVVIVVALAAGGCTEDRDHPALPRPDPSDLFMGSGFDYRLAVGAGQDAPDKAKAYRLAPVKVDRARVAKLAAAFGVHGTVEDADGRALVVDDETGHVGVGSGQATQWTYQRAGADDTPGLAPGKAEAEAIARRVLAKAGIDLRDTEVHVNEVGSRRSVVFQPEVGGLPVSGLRTSVGFDNLGRIDNADGYLAGFEALDDYDLAGPATVLARLKPPPGGGDRQAVEVVEVELALGLVAGGGRAYLVPAFVFVAGGLGAGPVVAVADTEFSSGEQRPVP